MKKAIQYGAGNIGRGFIGKILNESGYEVIFADINKDVIEKLSKEKKYVVEIVGEDKKIETVQNISGVFSNSADMVDLINEVEIITTAVGPNVLKIIALQIAEGIKKRKNSGNTKFLNIIACENMINASSLLKEEVLKKLENSEKEYVEKYIGFPNAAVDRIVPPSDDKSDITKVVVEEFKEWIVDKKLFKGNIPEITGMTLTENLEAFVERKLFTLNTGHAVTAYLGVLKGFSTIKESIENSEIREKVIATMKESGNVLIKRYNFNEADHLKYIEKIISRFKNPYLKDEVGRVGREPLRKLGNNDRLIKPLRGTIEYNLKNDNLIYGVACALAYRNSSDPQAEELQKKLEKNDLKKAIKEITGLDRDDIIERISKEYLSVIKKQ
ncbi:MAG: mannitol-1-phosphate 5-dehydrogenase [Fusobacteriaceae bacterium]